MYIIDTLKATVIITTLEMQRRISSSLQAFGLKLILIRQNVPHQKEVDILRAIPLETCGTCAAATSSELLSSSNWPAFTALAVTAGILLLGLALWFPSALKLWCMQFPKVWPCSLQQWRRSCFNYICACGWGSATVLKSSWQGSTSLN